MQYFDREKKGIDLTNTMILWDCEHDWVVLVKHPCHKQLDGDSWGACNTEIRTADFDTRKMALFIQAWQMAHDGVSPAKIHKALMPLDEYRNGIADDRLWYNVY